jgi:hypothetical protein
LWTRAVVWGGVVRGEGLQDGVLGTGIRLGGVWQGGVR